jgi:hypothetical protein
MSLSKILHNHAKSCSRWVQFMQRLEQFMQRLVKAHAVSCEVVAVVYEVHAVAPLAHAVSWWVPSPRGVALAALEGLRKINFVVFPIQRRALRGI